MHIQPQSVKCKGFSCTLQLTNGSTTDTMSANAVHARMEQISFAVDFNMLNKTCFLFVMPDSITVHATIIT